MTIRELIGELMKSADLETPVQLRTPNGDDVNFDDVNFDIEMQAEGKDVLVLSS